nr:unnamed protein product [Callosobruchus analis]
MPSTSCVEENVWILAPLHPPSHGFPSTIANSRTRALHPSRLWNHRSVQLLSIARIAIVFCFRRAGGGRDRRQSQRSLD